MELEQVRKQSGDTVFSKSPSSYVADQDKSPSFLKLIPWLFSFRNAAQTQTQIHRYAHTYIHTHRHICIHMHIPAHTHTNIHTHTPGNVPKLTHALMLTYKHTHTHAQIHPQLCVHTPPHPHFCTPRYLYTCTYIHTHHFIHWEGFFLSCWNSCIFRISNIAAALIP